jgi:hypothetical protein
LLDDDGNEGGGDVGMIHDVWEVLAW